MRTTTTEVIHYRVNESPVGDLLVAADADTLRAIVFLGHTTHARNGDSPHRTPRQVGVDRSERKARPERIREMLGEAIEIEPSAVFQEGGPIVNRTAKQLEEYFAGKRKEFDLPLAPAGTEFQQRVWKALLRIGHGETWSYADLANSIGKPTASRAVGAANRRNPIPIVIPCHRVIGADGSLTGYGGGVDIKRALLELEGWGLFGGIVRERE